jgi:phenylalanyl-tRNA synthetase beta chain
MKALVSWLRDLVEIPDGLSIDALAHALHMSGFELAGIEREGVAEGDAVIDFEITANRPDTLSVIGLAREISALYDTPLRGAALQSAASGLNGTSNNSEASGLKVTIEDPSLCPRYAAAVADITIGPSPAWLSARLAAAGIRSINNIVDITNYVLIETGHPLHAFDLALLEGPHLKIRRAKPGEKVKTLDGQERTLAEDMLVIADASRAQAVAGVMGGGDSEVSEKTRTIALESAYFTPSSIRRTSKRLGLSTEASYRFERGADPEAPARALARACELIEQIGAGHVRPDWIDARATTRTPIALTLRHEQIARILGYVAPPDVVERVMTRLGFELSSDAAAQGSGVASSTGAPSSPAPVGASGRGLVWQVTVPSWRVDVTREIDLIEEVARVYGYDRIPTTFPALRTVPPAPDARLQRDRAVRQMLRAAGFHEASTLAFIERGAALDFTAEPSIVAIANPLSEKFAVLRPSLLPGLVDALAYNRRREQRDIRLYEAANCFTRDVGERRRVAAVWTGAASAPHWSGSGRAADVFDPSGVVTALGATLGLDTVFVPAERPYLTPAVAGAIQVRRRANGGVADGANANGARDIGIIGQLLPAVADTRGIPANEPVFLFEIDLDAVLDWTSLGDRLRVTPLPRHPSVVRDVSIALNADLPSAQVRDTIRAAAPVTLERVVEFDRYQGKGVPDGQCSLSLRLTFRAPDRTLTDAEIQDAMDRIIAALASTHGAALR